MDGMQAVYDAVILALRTVQPEAKLQLLESTVDITGKGAWDSISLKKKGSAEIHALLSDVLKTTENYQRVVRQFLNNFADGE